MASFEPDDMKPTGSLMDTPDEQEKTMPLMSGAVGPEGLPQPADLELTSMKPPSKLLNQGTLLIVGLFVIGAVSLFAMRVGQADITGRIVSQDIEAKIEQALIKLSRPDALDKGDALAPGNMDKTLSDMDQFVEMFVHDSTEQQVPLRYVKKNPFVLPVYKSSQPEVAGRDPSEEEKERQRQARKTQLEMELGGLELRSVLQSAGNPIAIIGEGFYQQGQSVGSFTITQIDQLSVMLTSEGYEFKLEMKESSGPGRGRRRR